MEEIKITKLSSGDKSQELAGKINVLIEAYSTVLTGFEIVGVLDSVKVNFHDYLMEEEDGKDNRS